MRRLTVLAALLLAAACADEIPEDVSARMEAARAATEAAADTLSGPDPRELLRTAPPGGHADWIRDVRVGLDTVLRMAGDDRREALHALQELYSRRFEAIDNFYGAGGAIDAGEGVRQAIGLAAAQLQQLMRLLAGNEGDASDVEQNVRAAQAALQQIEDAARSAGLQPNAPRDVIDTIP